MSKISAAAQNEYKMSVYNSVVPDSLSVPQSKPLDNRQVINNQGGFVYTVSSIELATRFLILGTAGGTFYAKEKTLTIESAKHFVDFINERGVAAVDLVVDVARHGRAPKRSPGLFALALCIAYGDLAVRQAAYANIPVVCSTQALLFEFISYIGQFRKGISGGLQKALRHWYGDKTVKDCAYQLVKYQSRKYGSRIVTARNAFRMFRPLVKPDDHARRALYDWAMNRPNMELLKTYPELSVINDMLEAHSGVSGPRRYELASNLSWEMIPDAWKVDPEIWNAMLPHMGMTAMIRNLSVMTRNGLLTPKSEATKFVVDKLHNQELLVKKNIHPAHILTALAIYRSGGASGLSDKYHIPTQAITDALDDAFYLAYPTIIPANKRTLIAIDASGSMEWPQNNAGIGMTAREAACAISMTMVQTEPNIKVCAFTSDFVELPLKPGHRIKDAITALSRVRATATDCAQPMIEALHRGWKIDTFVVLTDNETAHGIIHPKVALENYRKRTGINAKLVVAAMTPTPFSIADPNDPGSMDVVGFDKSLPKLINDFSRGMSTPQASSSDEGEESE